MIRYNPNLTPYIIDVDTAFGGTGEIELKEFPYGIPVKAVDE